MDDELVREWWNDVARDLPWRRTRDPWSVLVAEVMLQQTQVDRVEPRWDRFLRRFPDPESCAAAQASAVIEEWAGVGYNRRAVNLHRCATRLTEDHDGRLPDDLASLLALPGIGPYTARAVLVFAFEQDHGVVDTTVARILARQFGRQLTAGEAQEAADAAVPSTGSWWWNQAVLDLGALLCSAREPVCDGCPVRPSCHWQGGVDGSSDPAVGSARVAGGQSRFEGSDRQGRGRLVAALRSGPLEAEDLADVTGWPDDPARVRRAVEGLVRDGLVVEDASGVRLP
jgi:A/G-specific adenine glycosylase